MKNCAKGVEEISENGLKRRKKNAKGKNVEQHKNVFIGELLDVYWSHDVLPVTILKNERH